MLLNFAFKNIWRHSRRTILTITVIAFGVVTIVSSSAFINGAALVWAQQEINANTSAFQISHVDYRDKHTMDPIAVTLKNSTELIQKIKSIPGVVSVSGQLNITGVVSSGSKSSIFDGKAIDVDSYITTLPDNRNLITGGNALGKDDLGVVLGEFLAKNLDLSIGDTVIVAVRTLHGGLDLMYGTLVGVKNGSHFPASSYLEMHLPKAQRLLKMEDRVSQLLVRVDKFDNIPATIQLTQEKLSTIKTPLVIHDYVDLIDMYAIVMSAFQAITYLVGFVLYIVVGGGIANSMYMAVRERRKEIGTLLAIGMKSSDIKLLFIFEGGVIGAIGAMFGVLSALILSIFLVHNGGLTFKHEDSNLTILPLIDWSNIMIAMCMALIVGALAAWLPAAQAAKLEPIVCLSDA